MSFFYNAFHAGSKLQAGKEGHGDALHPNYYMKTSVSHSVWVSTLAVEHHLVSFPLRFSFWISFFHQVSTAAYFGIPPPWILNYLSVKGWLILRFVGPTDRPSDQTTWPRLARLLRLVSLSLFLSGFSRNNDRNPSTLAQECGFGPIACWLAAGHNRFISAHTMLSLQPEQ